MSGGRRGEGGERIRCVVEVVVVVMVVFVYVLVLSTTPMSPR